MRDVHLAMLVLLGCGTGPSIEPPPSTPPPVSSPDPAAHGPEIAVLAPTLTPGAPIELWVREGPAQLFQPSPHRFEKLATVLAIESPFQEGGVVSADIFAAVWSADPRAERPTLWAKSLQLGRTISGSGISVDDDPTADLSNYVGKTTDGTLVMLLEIGP